MFAVAVQPSAIIGFFHHSDTRMAYNRIPLVHNPACFASSSGTSYTVDLRCFLADIEVTEVKSGKG
jgi:hypothetical protein